MELNSTGQVSSLIPEATRPNAPAQAKPEAVAAAPAGGLPVNAASAVVVDVSADFDAGSDRPAPGPKETAKAVDITV